jgi:UDPglucose 6-dehydrogenase
MHLGRAHGVPMRLAEATHLANEEQAHFLAQLVEQAVGPLGGKTIALWGLAFKPETDDIRESPAAKLTAALLAKGASVVGHDPEAGRNFAKAMATHGASVKVVDRDYDALDGAHALVLLTEWRSYRAPNFAEIRKRLVDGERAAPPVVVDGRNVWRPHDVMRAGLRYQGIGVPSATAAADRVSKTTLL